MKVCKVCGWQRAWRRGRCSGDYQFRRRTGRDRTPDEVMRAYYRKLDKVARIVARPDVAS